MEVLEFFIFFLINKAPLPSSALILVDLSATYL